MEEKAKKLLGPKFRPYFMLHLRMVRGELIASAVFALIAGVIWGEFDFNHLVLTSILVVGWSIRAFYKTDSRMLYQREAYLYQSFPLSVFGTAFTKTASGALVPAAGLITATIMAYGLSGILAVPMIMAGSLLAGGIILTAIGFGNSLRDSRAKKPSTFASVIAAILMFAIQAGLIVVFVKYVPMETGLKLLILTAVFLIEAAAFLWHNTRNLKYNYQV